MQGGKGKNHITNTREIGKKDGERGASISFLKQFGLSPDSANVVWSEEPDMRFPLDGKIIGVEITKCVVSDLQSGGKMNMQRTGNYTQKILEDCKAALSGVLQGFELHIDFSAECKSLLSTAHPDLNKIRNQILAEILNCIRAKAFSSSDTFNKTADMYCAIYSDAIWGVKLQGTDALHIMSGFEGGFVQSLDPQFIQYSIKKKELKLRNYRSLAKNKDIDEFWLLVSIPYGEYYSLELLRISNVNSNYDRIYMSSCLGGCERIK